MSRLFLSLPAELPPRRQRCWAWAVNSSSAVHLLAPAPHPVLWAGLPLVSFLWLLSLSFFLRGLKLLWLFLGLSGWFQPSRRCWPLGWQPPGNVWEMPWAQFKLFLVASVRSVLWNILFNKKLHRVALFPHIQQILSTPGTVILVSHGDLSGDILR